MPWIPYKKNSTPDKHGEYFVIKFYPGTNDMGFFKPIPPEKKIELMYYMQIMELEQDFPDRCIYVKHNIWEDQHRLKQKPENILYWFELDPIPEE